MSTVRECVSCGNYRSEGFSGVHAKDKFVCVKCDKRIHNIYDKKYKDYLKENFKGFCDFFKLDVDEGFIDLWEGIKSFFYIIAVILIGILFAVVAPLLGIIAPIRKSHRTKKSIKKQYPQLYYRWQKEDI